MPLRPPEATGTIRCCSVEDGWALRNEEVCSIEEEKSDFGRIVLGAQEARFVLAHLVRERIKLRQPDRIHNGPVGEILEPKEPPVRPDVERQWPAVLIARPG